MKWRFAGEYPTANPSCLSHVVTAERSCGVGEKRSRNSVGERNWPAFALPGVETDNAKAAAASPPRQGRYTRKTTAEFPSAVAIRFAAVAHEGTLPDSVVREGGAAEMRMSAMQLTASAVSASVLCRGTWNSLGGHGRSLSRRNQRVTMTRRVRAAGLGLRVPRLPARRMRPMTDVP